MNRKFIFRALIICFALLSFIGASMAAEAGESGKKNFLWKARSGSGTAYLFGSVHLAKPDFYPLPSRIEESFNEADALALEADPANEADPDLRKRMLLAALYANGDTLRQHLSKETYDLAAMEMKEIGLPIEQFGRIKPWFLALTIEILELQRLGYNPEYGIDRYFAGKARGRKKIVELESFDYQLRLLNGFTDREQELFLLYTIRDLKTVGKELDLLIHAWRTGDAKAMESIVTQTVNESPELLPVFEKLFYRRNREMADKIAGFLKSKDTYFVVVGAAHLAGKQGIIELLKGKGYKVEQL
jgi:uncharacterized protein YbaP (TraB family)